MFTMILLNKPQFVSLSGIVTLSLGLLGVGSTGHAQDLPTGGQVIEGTASIGTAYDGSQLITQMSERAVINWSSFDVGAGSQLNFVQPDANAAILNRVTGSADSSIAGQINANGAVFLINPNGIQITKQGQINVGRGFVASTLDIDNGGFMRGSGSFEGSEGEITLDGVINVQRNGYVGLLARDVRMNGLIAAPAGSVVIAAGRHATLDINGDGFLQVTAPPQTQLLPGGQIGMIDSEALRTAVRNVVNLPEAVDARWVSGVNGDIVLGGEIVASAGKVIVETAGNINLAGARIDVSAISGGGTVNIGGDYQGGGSLIHAQSVTIDPSTLITADAKISGDGGKVILWSDEMTDFAGSISARGGMNSGNGGLAEVSGAQTLRFTGKVDLTAKNGRTGDLLLDPYNITISNAVDTNSTGFTATGDNSIINVITLQNALATANVIVSTGSGGAQSGDISIIDPISWVSDSSLTLTAFRNIEVNANVTNSGGSEISLRADSNGLGAGTISFTGAQVSTSGTVNIYYNPTSNPFTVTPTVNGASYLTADDFTPNVTGGAALSAYMLVNNVFDLQNIDNNLAGNYSLGTDLDASTTASWNAGAGFVPIGDDSASVTHFVGVLDGLGNDISGLVMNPSTSDHVGMFSGTAVGSILRNINIVGGSITSQHGTGMLVGRSRGDIMNITSSATVTASGDYIGGLVGEIESGGITNSSVTGNVTGDKWVGGLTGPSFNYDSDIVNSFSTGNVISTSAIYAGGLAPVWAGSITDSYATSDITGVNGYGIGGLVGYAYGDITRSYATGDVNGTDSDYVGGLVGYVDEGTISQSRAEGNVVGNDYVGGLVGYADFGMIITQSYATGSVSGNDSIGGLVGVQDAEIIQTYAVGAVTGATNTGGLVGDIDGGTISQSVWDITTTGLANGVGTGGESGTTGLTTAQMLDLSNFKTTYTGWDFQTVWSPPNQTGQGGVSAPYYPQFYTLSDVIWIKPTGADRVYADANSFSYNAYGLQGTDTLLAVPSVTGAEITSNVGSYAVTASGAAAFNALGSPYRVVYTDEAMDVTPRPVTFIPNGQSRLYGEANPLAGGFTITSGSLGNSDVVTSLTINSTAGVNSNIGTYDLSANGLGFSSGSALNYTISYQPLVGGLTVIPRPIVFTPVSESRLYGEINPSTGNFAITSGSLVNSNVVASLTINSTADVSSDIGTYDLTANGLSFSSGSALNYAISYQPLVGGLTVTPRPITFMPAAQSRFYGNENPETGEFTIVSGSLVNDDDVTSLILGSAANMLSDIGSYDLLSSGVNFSNGNALNYAINYQPLSVGLAVIPRPITFTPLSQTRLYGETNPSVGGFAITTGSFANSDAVTSVTLGSAADMNSNIGSYDLLANGVDFSSGSALNYAISYQPLTSGLMVTARPIEIMADTLERLIAEENPDLTYQINGVGLINGDSLTGELVTNANIASSVGEYPVQQGTLAVSNNYLLTFVEGALNVQSGSFQLANLLRGAGPFSFSKLGTDAVRQVYSMITPFGCADEKYEFLPWSESPESCYISWPKGSYEHQALE